MFCDMLQRLPDRHPPGFIRSKPNRDAASAITQRLNQRSGKIMGFETFADKIQAELR